MSQKRKTEGGKRKEKLEIKETNVKKAGNKFEYTETSSQ
jgi:hypothetical protein